MTKRINAFLTGVVLIVLVAVMTTAEASGDKITQNTHVAATGSATAGGGMGMGGDSSTMVEGDRSDALGIGLGSNGAAAINDCLYTVQVGFGAGQWVKPNKICLAEKLDQMGKYEAAAKMRCTIDAIQKIFPDKAECVSEMQMTPEEPEETPRETSHVPRLENEIAILKAENDMLRADLSARIDTLDDEVKQAKRLPRPAPAPAQTIIQKEEFLTEDKRARLAGLVGK